MTLRMPHRAYRGRIAYLHDAKGLRGHEDLHVTVQPDGSRSVRAACEMYDIELLRDVTYTVDGAWRPVDSYVRLVSHGRFVGAAWFRFDDEGAECEGWTAGDGRFSQRVDLGRRPTVFVPHPICTDGWQASAYDFSRGPGVQRLDACTNSSPRADGGSGPMIGTGWKRLEYVGDETVTVPAGTFQARHMRILHEAESWPPLEFWVAGEDFLFLRMRWDLLATTYELVELAGETR